MTTPGHRHAVKAYGYVTSGSRLLVFREPDFPKAGIQVPGGTVENGELPEAGILRELREEIGRDDFVVHARVARRTFTFDQNGVHHVHDRHYFHVTPSDDWPETWQNYELHPNSGEPPILFEFFWMPLPAWGLVLNGHLDEAFDALYARLGMAPV